MAEMCLHRTRADQVLPVFRRLVELAPTPQALLLREDEAREIMRPLGLRWRGDNILKVARQLVDRWGGVVPESSLGLRSLPGVGDYVAGAVLCFAFGRRAVLVDTNTERIVGRVRGDPRVRRAQMRMDLHDLAGRDGPDRDFNFALLDLGALVCRAARPHCPDCPLRQVCATGSGRPVTSIGALRSGLRSEA
jgi:A/G-specific adenine glycosylase